MGKNAHGIRPALYCIERMNIQMRIIKTKTYEEMSAIAAGIIGGQVLLKPNCSIWSSVSPRTSHRCARCFGVSDSMENSIESV